MAASVGKDEVRPFLLVKDRLSSIEDTFRRRLGLAYAVREYLRAEGLFPWMTYHPLSWTTSKTPYDILFQVSKPEGPLPVTPADDIASIIGQDYRGHEHFNSIISVAARLAEALASGGYDLILDVITEAEATEGGATYGSNSIIASSAPVNVIPGTGSGPCRPMLVAFSAHKKRGPVEPLRATLPKVREHLIRCFGVTKVVILVMDESNPAVFNESRRDIVAHRDMHTVFVPLLVNGNRLTPVAMPF
jgi:hypothetical protein